MIRIKVWHNGNLGNLVYPSGYYDEYTLNAEVREHTPTSEREVDNSDGRDIVQNYVITNNKICYFYVEEPMFSLIQIIPMYENIEVYDVTNDIMYADIYNVQLIEEDSYNNRTVKEFSLRFSYKNFISRNSV